MSRSLAVLLLISSFQLARVASFSLSIRPDHVHTSMRPESVSITCSADAALIGCQFRWWDYKNKAGPLLELSRGSESQTNSTYLDTWLAGYSYSGRGLLAGDCGVSLQVNKLKRWMVACRVRAETGGWTYAWTDLYADYWKHLPNTLIPRESVVLPGGEAKFTLKAQESLSGCLFYLPGFSLDFDQGAKSNHSAGSHRYLGGGLGGGECGLALTNVSEADNGPVRSWIYNTALTKHDHRFMILIVARHPDAPTLEVVYTDAGVTATCQVHGGRPVANITWFLGDEVVRQDSLDDRSDSAQEEWRWPWLQGSSLQRLTLRRQDEDDGKVLKCVASHVALTKPLEATEIISFTDDGLYSLSIRPDHLRTSAATQSVSFSCSADAVLTGCQFRWWDRFGKAGPLLELSHGSEPQANPTHLNRKITGYSYSGRGLVAGDCGVSLQVKGQKWWMVSCRVRTKIGSWTYAWADLDVDYRGQLPTTLTPRESVVLPGGEARFTLEAQEPLSWCFFNPPGLRLDFNDGAQSDDSTGRHRYLGSGLEGGECGLTLRNVSEADNGRVWSSLGNLGETKVDYRFMTLIVARPPGAPTLEVVYTPAGVTATCEVHKGRPVANITWVISDEVVRQDSQDDRPSNAQDEWRWPWMEESILQRLTLGRQGNYYGRVLKCVASHIALTQPLEASAIILYRGS